MNVNVVVIDGNAVTLRHMVAYLERARSVSVRNEIIACTLFPMLPVRSESSKVDVDATYREASKHGPGVAVIDLRLDGHAPGDFSGATLSFKLKRACPNCCIILVSHHFGADQSLLDHLEIFRFRIDRNQKGFGKELQDRLATAVRHYASAIEFAAMLDRPVTAAVEPRAPAVYISYAHGDQDGRNEPIGIVERIQDSLEKHGLRVNRDVTSIDYGASIDGFMKQMGSSICVVVLLSERYLRSRFCMYELLEIYRNPDFTERVCPVVFPAVAFSSVLDRLHYVRHWQEQAKEVEAFCEEMGLMYLSDRDLVELRLYQEIGTQCSELLSALAKMYYPPLDELERNDFEVLRIRVMRCLNRRRRP